LSAQIVADFLDDTAKLIEAKIAVALGRRADAKKGDIGFTQGVGG
jgi:hypothetical protein